jgi:hypothetical protein
MYDNTPMHTHEVTIRLAEASEWDAVDRLAQLDSAPPPPRDSMLVAEVGGELQAAISIRNGYAVANPFESSGEHVELLRARAAQLNGGGAHAAGRRSRFPLLRTSGARSPAR